MIFLTFIRYLLDYNMTLRVKCTYRAYRRPPGYMGLLYTEPALMYTVLRMDKVWSKN